MINYKLGCNFDFKLIEDVKILNEQYSSSGSKINEFYGSERRMAWLTARPDFRLPDITKKEFENYISICNKYNIEFNYTMNTINPGTKSDLFNTKRDELQDFVKYLQDIGVKRITIANPLIMALVCEVSNIEIEVSTIAHIDTITQIKYLKETFGISKVCGSILKNRCIGFLKKAAKWCNENGIIYELMANEFCGAGGKDYFTHCPLRDSCYIFHSTDKTKLDAERFNYPMGYCIFGRKSDLYNWLRCRFIRPEDILRYVKIGINNFKLTGRTGSTDYLIKLAEGYLKQSWPYNLLELWKPLETIYSGQNELDFKHPGIIDNKKLNGFVDHWFDMPNFDCAEEICGETCVYCSQWYERINK
jgi:hypothetical protein